MEDQNKSAALQWIIPSAVLLVVLMVMLFNFSKQSTKDATELVYRELISKTEDAGDKFNDQLTVLHSIAAPMVNLLENEGTSDAKYVQEILGVVLDCSRANEVYYCDLDGAGYDRSGQEVSVGDTAYFQTILNQSDVGYVYAEASDGPGQDSVVVVSAIPEQGYLLLYYSLKGFGDLTSMVDTDQGGYLLLLDGEGKVLAQSGAEEQISPGDNLVEILEKDNAAAAKTIRNRIKNGARGTSGVNLNGREAVLVYTPLGMNHWEMVMGVSKASVDRQIEVQWQSSRQTLIGLIVVIFVFICVVMIINIVAKISSNEKKKQLEDKADTDLLTGLNNKLATERKIKNYMAQNPQSQSMLFLLDIDNFKKINDTMGHAFGDEVLRSLGQQIGANFRATDIIGRIGGDEFMIFLKGIEEPAAIRKEAKKIENFFKGFQAGEYVKYAATASIGVAIFPQEGADFESLYKAADQGLYKAKKRGKNQLAFYRDEWVQETEDKK